MKHSRTIFQHWRRKKKQRPPLVLCDLHYFCRFFFFFSWSQPQTIMQGSEERRYWTFSCLLPVSVAIRAYFILQRCRIKTDHSTHTSIKTSISHHRGCTPTYNKHGIAQRRSASSRRRKTFVYRLFRLLMRESWRVERRVTQRFFAEQNRSYSRTFPLG